MFKMESVERRFLMGDIMTYALKDFDLSIDAGEFVAVEGPSGAGKTTFLNIAGLLDPMDAGSYHLDGLDVSQLSDKDRSVIRNQKIGFIFQGFNLIPELTAEKNVELPLRLRGMKAAERQERVARSLEQVGLESRSKHLPSKLSGGQQQRVAIARALAGQPSIILADEPTGNLDSNMAAQIMDMLTAINDAGTTIIMVTHSPESAKIAKRRIEVCDGKIMED
ncbi:MAG: ABC transporter ATP-binding protein [Pseudomonadales bacterium]|nr:ABC transporter ATP-binding protein [Pseudomonadales bacterium]MBO6596605.1 ABC transporter ATP-binding protein [Pseudomonadales bacterium]MBO6823406.1 ABC transporter ATP-binding protein [Pseudomonadales bacterium]